MSHSIRLILLKALPYLLLISIYLFFSIQRHAENPQDKLLPMPSQLAAALNKAVTPDELTGQIILLTDTVSSLGRLIAALLLSGGIALVLALTLHTSKIATQSLHTFIVTIAKIPPIALMPILLLWLGINETARVGLVVIGLVPYLTLHIVDDLERTKRKIAEKLRTLHLNAWQTLFYIDVPIILPAFLNQMQANLGPAWLFLLMAETVGAEQGLGYRIFVVRRYLAMDTILVYVAWIALLSIALFFLFEFWKRKFDWYFHE